MLPEVAWRRAKALGDGAGSAKEREAKRGSKVAGKCILLEELLMERRLCWAMC